MTDAGWRGRRQQRGDIMPPIIFGQRRRIVLGIVAYILFAAFGIGWTLVTFIEERDAVMMRNISLFLMRGVQAQAYELTSQFQYKLLGMQTTAQEAVQNSEKRIDGSILRLCTGRILADNLFVTSADGQIWSQSPVPGDLLEKPFYRQVLAGQPAVSSVLTNTDGTDMVVLAIPVIYGIRLLGTIGAIYRCENFTNFFQLTSFLSGDGAILLDEDGRLVGASPNGREATDYFLELYRRYLSEASRDDDTDTRVLPMTDRQGQAVHFCVGDLPLNGWRVVTAITNRELSLDLNDRAQVLRNLFVRLCILFVLTMIFVTLVMRALFARRMGDLEREASTDPLTGLLNRATFERRVEACLNERKEGLLAVFDLDNFKQINDRHGHPAGDAVICRVGDLLRKGLPENSLFGRLGGDEFVLFLPRITSSEAGIPCLDELLNRIRGDELLRRYAVTASMGVSVAPQDGRVFPMLYRCADVALYASKRFGRNRISSYEQVQGTPLSCISEQ